MSTPLFTGTATALVTPFTADGAVDEAAFRRLIDYQIDHGVEALVVLGTTGENPTVTDTERARLVDLAVEQAGGRVPVIVGTGDNDTRRSIAFARQAAAAGADGQLLVGPYYNKPTQDGFRAHVAAVAGAADLPIILYNVPGRTSFNMTAETVLRLAEEVPLVRGIKEASGNLAQITDILAHRPASLAVYAGDDEMALPLAALGADGVVSVIANALPGPFGELVRAALAGDLAAARRRHFALLPAMRACFFETNPIPIKAVLAEMGLIAPELRLPLLPAAEPTRRRVLEAFAPFVHAVA
ncbi:4-hydroxy-tetrahydrodipicolinate synthase [Rhodocaloribacter litoris]|uniref:4-hydroxy-tetrahydrodipicolinate synthase n=1 Tax=Rhodocaloribacter litoris TaxID=2558931 RepID=UPI0014216445|nr:4-hydroxy-tetrahydrodipicolinate synthase [Rhodocaloribacter litoris]QXD16245.1 4-hydroxy-tetrahydrodipicolinate synthase [Rhodocaloribacter litoris]